LEYSAKFDESGNVREGWSYGAYIEALTADWPKLPSSSPLVRSFDSDPSCYNGPGVISTSALSSLRHRCIDALRADR
jgi:hypothetical protein